MSYFCKTSTPMRREENQPPRPTAGFWSVPLFNHKKRNRIPLTSAPSENEFFSHTEFMESSGLDTSNSTSGTYGCHQTSGVSQSHVWNGQSIPSAPPQQYGSNRPAPGPVTAARHYAPVSHPYKGGGTGYKTLQHSDPVGQQESSSITYSRQSGYQTPYNRAQIKSASHSGFSQMGQKSLRPPGSTQCQPSRPLPGSVPSANRSFVQTVHPQNSWKSRKFTNSFGSGSSSSEGNRGTNQTQKSIQKKVQEKTKPAVENSLRILTAVIDGMRHWSKFKDRVPNLFEIFATLDSAVTLGHHGAKNFLMRDGKETVQCVFYENEKELPRLIRGQLHRCVGNYDRRRDVLMCVSVRPSLPSELRNAQEAVKVCDAEMRMLVKSLSEV